MSSHLVDLLALWSATGMEEKGFFFGCLCHAVLWNLWRERNLQIFEDKHKPFKEVIDSIIQQVRSWLFVTKQFQGYPQADFVRD